eukprot:2516403-Pleurochrysis_carterae.AAC.3
MHVRVCLSEVIASARACAERSASLLRRAPNHAVSRCVRASLGCGKVIMRRFQKQQRTVKDKQAEHVTYQQRKQRIEQAEKLREEMLTKRVGRYVQTRVTAGDQGTYLQAPTPRVVSN